MTTSWKVVCFVLFCLLGKIFSLKLFFTNGNTSNGSACTLSAEALCFLFLFFPSLDKKSRCKTANYRVQLHTANTENAVSVTSYLHEALGGLWELQHELFSCQKISFTWFASSDPVAAEPWTAKKRPERRPSSPIGVNGRWALTNERRDYAGMGRFCDDLLLGFWLDFFV